MVVPTTVAVIRTRVARLGSQSPFVRFYSCSISFFRFLFRLLIDPIRRLT